MSVDPVERLLAEATHLPPVDDTAQDRLRWAILVEDVLGVVLSDEDITAGELTDPERLRHLMAASPPPG
jgi:hypothetical protein